MTVHRRRMPAQHQRSRKPLRRRHIDDDRGHDGNHRLERHLLSGPAGGRDGARACEDRRERRLQQSGRQALPAGTRHARARQVLEREHRAPLSRDVQGDKYAKAGLDAPVYAVQNADDIIIAVVGGAGKHSAYIPTFGATKAVTRALKRADGKLAKSAEEFLPLAHNQHPVNGGSALRRRALCISPDSRGLL